MERLIFEIDDEYAFVKESEEVSAIKEAVENFMKQIVEEVQKEDERFAIDLIQSGGTYENTKVIQQDEFDFLASLKVFQKAPEGDIDFLVVPKSNVHASIKLCNEKFESVWSDMIIIEGNVKWLDSTKLKQRFNNLVFRVVGLVTSVENLKFITTQTKSWSKSKLLSGCVTFQPPEVFTFLWKDNLKISVDLVPFVNCSNSNLSGYLKDLVTETSNIQSNFLIVNLGLVGRADLFWRLSYSQAETAIFKYFAKEFEFVLVHYRVLKYLNETHFITKNNFQIHLCSTYVLKNALLHQWYQNRLTDDIQKTLIHKTLNYMIECYAKSHLATFFNSNTNILKDSDYSFKINAIKECLIQLENATSLDDFVKSRVVIQEKQGKSLRDRKIKKV
uniref:Mab-21-like nucleotidyltransferase domain-containing protein n=1 Tax=Clytia hemisphaerica TaxID=252671 RepID=A0A7M5VGN4_9CNID